MIKRRKLGSEYKNLLAFAIVGLVISIVVRLILGSNVVFYACFGNKGFFPGRILYSFIYFIRIILSSLMLGVSALFGGFGKQKRLMIVVSLACFVSVLAEYKLLFFCRSILFMIGMLVFFVAGNISVLRHYEGFDDRLDWAVLSVCFSLMQIYMLLCIVSVIL